ncbi:MAG: molybdate ABC transporter permease subunit [Verrucomicrobiota bacterium]|nr:molybdate ABC transporter permease subunit [Verrucomicrobiota bacterium]
MSPAEWQVISFTLGMSLLATLLMTPFGIATGWLLARKNWIGKSIVETILSLPLVIPPVATGLILLKLFGRRGPVGKFIEEHLGLEIVFTWKGVLIALAVMSFPLLVRTCRVGFEQVNPRFEAIARSLGASRMRTFFTITLPLARNAIIAGMALAFARALGEFGATILVAGAIEGQTMTMSVSIFNSIQLGRDDLAIRMIGISLVLAFLALWLSEYFLRRRPQ